MRLPNSRTISFGKGSWALAMGLSAFLVPASKTTANDIAFFQTFFNSDYVTAGVGGMRNTAGPHTITLAGVSGTVSQAYLYWHGPTDAAEGTANANVTVNGNAVVGTNIGFSDNNCWGFVNSQAYRADVTAIVQATGNGNYLLTGFGTGTVNTNGASLIVIFDDGDPTNNSDCVVFDGNDSNINNPFDADGWNVSLPGINYSGGSASIQMHVADGQEFLDDALILNAAVLVPAGPIFQGASVPGVNNGPGNNGNLWDILTFDVTAFLVVGPNTLTLTTGADEDCLSLIVAVVCLPPGAAPEQATSLDIKPGSCPNSFNRNSHGVLPVALVGTESFDVTQVDISSIQLVRKDGEGGSVAPNEGPPGPHSEIEDAATPFDGEEQCDCHELEGDGIQDLIMKFRTDDVVAALGLDDFDPGALVPLTLTGNLLDGTPFSASDCVRLVPPGTGAGMMGVASNATGVFIDITPLDVTLDGGGFPMFERVYPQTTVVTLTAPETTPGWVFVGWLLNGGSHTGFHQGGGDGLHLDPTIQVIITDKEFSLRAIYLPDLGDTTQGR